MIIKDLDPDTTKKDFERMVEADSLCTGLILYRYPEGMKFDVQAAFDKMEKKLRAIMDGVKP
jgi:hypothetical protein